MSHHNANIVVKHARCHSEKINGVMLRQVCYTHLSITTKIVPLKRAFSFADALMTAYNLEIGRIKMTPRPVKNQSNGLGNSVSATGLVDSGFDSQSSHTNDCKLVFTASIQGIQL